MGGQLSGVAVQMGSRVVPDGDHVVGQVLLAIIEADRAQPSHCGGRSQARY